MEVFDLWVSRGYPCRVSTKIWLFSSLRFPHSHMSAKICARVVSTWCHNACSEGSYTTNFYGFDNYKHLLPITCRSLYLLIREIPTVTTIYQHRFDCT